MVTKAFLISSASLLLAAAAAGAAPGTARSAEEEFFLLEKASLEELLNQPMEVSGVPGEKALDSAALAQVITAETIRDRGYSTLLDLLEDIPQIEIMHGPEPGHSNNITVQGLTGAERFQVMIDGVRVTPITGNLYSLGRQFSLANARRVEIVLGPVSALYGADAFTGVVNIVTRTGREMDSSRAGVSYASFRSGEGVLSGGGGKGDLSAALTGHAFHSAGARMPDYYGGAYAWYNGQYRSGQMLDTDKATVVTGVPVRPFSMREDASFLHGRLNLRNFEAGWVEMSEAHSSSLGVKPQYTVYSRDAVFKTNYRTVYGRHTYEPDGGGWKFTGLMSHQAYEVDPETKFINNFSGYGPAYKYAMDESTFLDGKLVVKPWDGGALVFGADHTRTFTLPRTGDLSKAFDPDVSPASQGYIYPGSDVISSTMSIAMDFYSLRYTNTGLYGQLQLDLFEGAQFTAGARYDRNSRYGDSLNPRGGLVLKPSDTLSFKLLYGEAFLAPAPDKAYVHFGSFVDDGAGDIKSWYFAMPNPDLKPEKSRAGQAEGTWKLSERLWLTANAYYTRISDLHQMDSLGAGTFKGKVVAARGCWANRGSARTHGGTLRLDALSSLGRLSVNSYAAYSYSDGRIDGEPLPYSARSAVKAGLDLGYGRWNFSPRVVYQSRSYTETRNAAGEREGNPPFAVVNFSARCRAWASGRYRLSAHLDVRNLTNSRYYNAGQAGSMGFPDVPQQPISAGLGATLEF